MGHYDDSYEHDREELDKEDKEFVKSEFNKLSKKLNIKDKELILNIVEHINDWRGVYNLLNSKDE
jgi:hypothetical protein